MTDFAKDTNVLISREEALKTYQMVCAIVDCAECPFRIIDGAFTDWFTDCRLERLLKELPTVDVPERKVGEWVEPTRDGCITYDKHAYAECSACGEKAYLGWWMHYCPNCGSRMKGERNE